MLCLKRLAPDNLFHSGKRTSIDGTGIHLDLFLIFCEPFSLSGKSVTLENDELRLCTSSFPSASRAVTIMQHT